MSDTSPLPMVSHRSPPGDAAPAGGVDGSQTESLGVRLDNGVMHLELRRADKGNALSAGMVAALTAALQQASEATPRLLVISGAGKHFCTGFDLSALDQESDDSLLARFARVELMLQAIHAAPFPTLALAHGRVMGAGADLFCACSERWIVDDASFAFPGAAFGLVLGTGRLADMVGARSARAWVQGGVQFNAESALDAGLATHRLPPSELDKALAARCALAGRLDDQTQSHITQALDGARRPRGTAGDALDLARLLASAARPGLKQRISAYRAAQKRN